MTEPEQDSVAFEDPAYRAAVVDLLGAITYGEISAFQRLTDDAKLATQLAGQAGAGQDGGGAVRPHRAADGADLRPRRRPDGGDGARSSTPFDVFHAATAPSDWLEGLIKAYVGDGLAADFYVEIASYLDGGTRQLIVDSLADAGHSEFVVDRVRRAIEADHRVGGRLALWGRRLMGEALSQAQRVAAERDSLAALLAGGVDRPGMDLAALSRMFSRLTENHAKRMAELGLAS